MKCLGGLGKVGAPLGPGEGLRQGDASLPAAGVHRQILFATVGWFVGYYLAKRTEYVHAKLDRDLFEYIRQHPEDFKAAEKRRIGELLEDFYPVR
ncbi:PREDICTED: NADH dehydrogenase [ubiquinone] 1 subunit C2 [Nipponia nippon]|nr:PREDICTED: NADH dehydrogenase [ubiquinone] 1 subunit C2 [Nipponia nippon]